MRKLLLASAAIMLSTGIACAQTSSQNGMQAPDGAAQAGPNSSAPASSYGKMAPTAQPGAPGSDVSSLTPAPTGQAPDNGPNTAQASQGTLAPGKMAPNQTASAPATQQQAAMTPPANAGVVSHHTHGYGGTLPADGDARTYLKFASVAIKHHDKALADEALSRAETRMLDRSVDASTGAMPDSSPAIQAVEQARQAVNAGNYQQAASDTHQAMHLRGGMMMQSAGQAQPMGQPADTTEPAGTGMAPPPAPAAPGM